MSERREFVKVERMGVKARYSVETPITAETAHDRMDEVERRITDVATVKVELSDEQMDVLLRDIGDLIGRVGALEQRISDVNDAALYDFAQLEERIGALEQRIEKLERKLSRKSIDTSGESLKIADESSKSGGNE